MLSFFINSFLNNALLYFMSTSIISLDAAFLACLSAGSFRSTPMGTGTYRRENFNRAFRNLLAKRKTSKRMSFLDPECDDMWCSTSVH